MLQHGSFAPAPPMHTGMTLVAGQPVCASFSKPGNLRPSAAANALRGNKAIPRQLVRAFAPGRSAIPTAFMTALRGVTAGIILFMSACLLISAIKGIL